MASADLRSWLSVTQGASWLGPADVLATFPAATSTGGIRWAFPMPRARVTVTTSISFRKATVLVIQVK